MKKPIDHRISLFGSDSESDGTPKTVSDVPTPSPAVVVSAIPEALPPKVSSYHVVAHAYYGAQTLLVLTQYNCNIYSKKDKTRVVVAKNSVTATLRGISVEGIAKGSLSFGGTPDEVWHLLADAGILKEHIHGASPTCPALKWPTLLENLGLSKGTAPRDLFSLVESEVQFLSDAEGNSWRQARITSLLFPDVSFIFGGKPKRVGDPRHVVAQKTMGQAYFAAFNAKYPATHLICAGTDTPAF